MRVPRPVSVDRGRTWHYGSRHSQPCTLAVGWSAAAMVGTCAVACGRGTTPDTYKASFGQETASVRAALRLSDAADTWRYTRMKESSPIDRKSTRLNSSHLGISYAVFCLKKKI